MAQGECLDEAAEFITKNGIDYSSEKEMKIVAKMADHSSKVIRENALKMLGEVYKHLDENIWQVLGDVTPKVKGLLEARFKKIKGVPLGTLQASASMASFRPQTPMDNGLSSSIGLKVGQTPGKKSVYQQPTTARPTTGL